MKKKLATAVGISKNGKVENVTTDVLGKIYAAINCSIEDIMELMNNRQKLCQIASIN